jgi:murein DD-endopeptidase MepM/ murein hydrolase activator NlpD
MAVCSLALALAVVPPAASSGIWDRKGMEPYRLPLDRVWLSRNVLARPHHDHPASDLYVPMGTSVYAAQAGRVRAILSGSSCGLGVVIDGADGFRYTYCHGSSVAVGTGAHVNAGDKIMRSGNSGSSGRPHLHFEIEDARLRLKCPQPLMLSWWRGGQKTPRDAPYGGCSY